MSNYFKFQNKIVPNCLTARHCYVIVYLFSTLFYIQRGYYLSYSERSVCSFMEVRCALFPSLATVYVLFMYNFRSFVSPENMEVVKFESYFFGKRCRKCGIIIISYVLLRLFSFCLFFSPLILRISKDVNWF